MNRIMLILVLTVTILGCTLSTQVPTTDVSSIVNYTFQPETEKIRPKMYNWELKLTEADTPLVEGTLRLIRFVAVNTAGDRFESDVILRHE